MVQYQNQYKNFYYSIESFELDPSLIYLTQTDTTVGFLSNDDKKLSGAKQRNPNQKTLQVVDTFHTLNKLIRVPKKHRKFVRQAKTTTIIYPNKLAFRVVNKNSLHQNFLKKFHTMYSTSANKTKNKFDKNYAIDNSDVIVYTNKQLVETKASSIYRINKRSKKKIR